MVDVPERRHTGSAATSPFDNDDINDDSDDDEDDDDDDDDVPFILDVESAVLLKQTFASYRWPPKVVSLLGIHHVRALLVIGSFIADKRSVHALMLPSMLPHRTVHIVNTVVQLEEYLWRREAGAAVYGQSFGMHILVVNNIELIFPSTANDLPSESEEYKALVTLRDCIFGATAAAAAASNDTPSVFVIGTTHYGHRIAELIKGGGYLETAIKVS